MSRRIAAILATVVAGLMAVGIATAAVGPASDDSASTTSITSSTAPPAAAGVETGVAESADDNVGTDSTTHTSTTTPDDSSSTSTTTPDDSSSTSTTTPDDSSSTSTTTPDDSSSTSTTTPPAGDDSASSVTYNAGDGGTVTIASNGSSLTIVSVDPAAGWSFEVEIASGLEVEADFRNGTRRIQFNAQLEDGEVRIRVRSDNNG